MFLIICIRLRLLQKALLCVDRALLSNVEGLSMNGRNYTDFKMATVRPELIEEWFFLLQEAQIDTM